MPKKPESGHNLKSMHIAWRKAIVQNHVLDTTRHDESYYNQPKPP